jgi:hypothetical protein
MLIICFEFIGTSSITSNALGSTLGSHKVEMRRSTCRTASARNVSMKALDIPSTETAKCCRSTAKLDRDTFTTVASICDINEPSIATEATFQMPEGSLSALVSH